jgi:hypothetical protein
MIVVCCACGWNVYLGETFGCFQIVLSKRASERVRVREARLHGHPPCVITKVVVVMTLSSHVVEKLGEPVKFRILSCDYVSMMSFEGPEEGHKCRSSVDLKWAKVRVPDLIGVWEADGHEYDLVSANCWEYAIGTCAKGIGLCLFTGNLSSADSMSIIHGAADLKKVERIMPIDALRVLFKPQDPENRAMLELLERRGEISLRYKIHQTGEVVHSCSNGVARYEVRHQVHLCFIVSSTQVMWVL